MCDNSDPHNTQWTIYWFIIPIKQASIMMGFIYSTVLLKSFILIDQINYLEQIDSLHF